MPVPYLLWHYCLNFIIIVIVVLVGEEIKRKLTKVLWANEVADFLFQSELFLFVVDGITSLTKKSSTLLTLILHYHCTLSIAMLTS